MQTFACFEAGKVTKKSHEKESWSNTNWVISFEKGQLGEMQRIATKQPDGEAECEEQQQGANDFARLAATHSGRCAGCEEEVRDGLRKPRTKICRGVWGALVVLEVFTINISR